jgi:hypothetical protein
LKKYGRKGHGRYLDIGNWKTGAITKMKEQFVKETEEAELLELSQGELEEKIKNYAIANIGKFTQRENIIKAVEFVCGVLEQGSVEDESQKAEAVIVEGFPEMEKEKTEPISLAVMVEDQPEEKPKQEKVRRFEMPQAERLSFEDKLIFAFDLIEEIPGGDLEIDLIPAEIRSGEDIKKKIGELLNRSSYVDGDKASDEEIKKYWKELQELHKLGDEIMGLEKKNQICVTYEGRTYFINKKMNEAVDDLEKEAIAVVGKEYLKAFVFGIRSDFEEYVSMLKNHNAWRGLNENQKREKLEEGIVFFANRILDENSKKTDEKTREKIYKYAFSILK